ncbi:conjugal transfer protein TraF [Shewanella surugensis]|uniref:Conjugal transfer protein TraF n=1 Tax=Shewanella surugensis TaxID=212020 RepID=A0ABT0LAV9_9GAMM|nr:conjugal transfer protein TraF [Shewanella surugensis]MCL1124846.1 conjugal transfer protein TraF [Shewanella surugensis]
MRIYGQYWLLMGLFFNFLLSFMAHSESIIDEHIRYFQPKLIGFSADPFSVDSNFMLRMLPFYQGMTTVKEDFISWGGDGLSIISSRYTIYNRGFYDGHSSSVSSILPSKFWGTPVHPPAIEQVTEKVISVRFPLSIVDMPVSVGVAPKFRQTQVAVSSHHNQLAYEGSHQETEAEYKQSVTIDVQLSMMLADGFLLDVSAYNLLSQPNLLIETVNERLSAPMLTAGMAYDWNRIHFSTDIDLNQHPRWDEETQSQFWRIGGGMSMFDWIDVNVDYRYDVQGNQDDIYSMGSEFRFGDKFSVDFSGVYSQSNHIEGLLRTSYDF